MEGPESFEELLQGQRSRLVGLCARLTGNVFVAEDLAQEVLLEAWRHHDKLRDPKRVPQWLSGIARNCLSPLEAAKSHTARLLLD